MRTITRSRYFKNLFNEKLLPLGRKIEERAQRQLDKNREIKITELLTLFAAVLPLIAFTYWRLLLEEFNGEYFESYFNFSDVYYLLYYKATLLWYILLLLSVTIPVMVLTLRLRKFAVWMNVTIIFCLTVYFFSQAGYFLWYQTLLYTLLGLVILVAFLLYSKHALHVYIVFLGMFFVTAAQADADHIKKTAVKKDIKLKNGTFFMKKEDRNKYYVTSTSKLVLIYSTKDQKLISIDRDSIQY